MSTPEGSLKAESFNEYDSLASNPLTTHLTSGATPEHPSTQYSDYGFIAMLSLAQRLHIHFLPITWQAALGPVGEGGQAGINQALIRVQTSFAFKCFKRASQVHNFERASFQELISEMVVLSHPLIRQHPHVVRLEGVCWDVSQDDEVWPVLVFEKAHLGDLDQFISSSKGKKLFMEDRLNLCADIGIAIRDMHSNNIIHGDLKPKNVLVFEHEPNSYVARVADFGYSTRFCEEHDLIRIPKSRPWNAPEHHHRGFLAPKAKKLDVYSFGVVCLWLLLEGNSSMPLHLQTSQNDGQFTSFKDVLMSRTSDGSLLGFSIKLIEEHGDFSRELKERLCQFFNCTLTSDQDKRNADFDYLLHLLAPSRVCPQPLKTTASEPVPEQERFQLASSFYEFYDADFRLRLFIATQLESIASQPTQHLSQHTSPRDAALQLALCYQVGFGVVKDTRKAKNLIDEYGLLESELNREANLIKDVEILLDIQDGIFKNLTLQGYISPVNLSQHYRENKQLERAKEVYEREIGDAEDFFGHAHSLVIGLKYRLGQILKDQGQLKDAEELNAKLVEMTRRELGMDDQNTLNSMANLASIYHDRGRWKEAEELRAEVMERKKRTLGREHPGTLTSMANLASTYRSQGRWQEAEKLEVDLLETRKSILGQNHPETLASMANLASTIWNQGRWIEAEQLELQVVQRSIKALGEEHPSTLTWMANLASTYQDQGRWRDAQYQDEQVMESMKKVLGHDHPSTLTSMAKLASTLWNQGYWQDAENLLSQVVETRKRVLGQDHPSTLTSISNLASVYQKRGKWEEAEKLEVQVIEASSKVLGKDHPDTLTSVANLASIYRKQQRWREAELLEMRVLEISIRELGEDHPDSLTSMANLGATFWSQGRYAEAEELLSQVTETRKRVLGQDHPSSLTSMGNLALTYRSQKQWKKAEELEVQVMETRKRVIGEDHPDTLTSMNNLAHTLKSQSRSNEALELMAKCVQMQEEKLGTDHPSTKASNETLQSWQVERSS